MQSRTLIPRNIINSKGKIGYVESSQSWSGIKLKKELFSEFPELKEKRSKFSYELIYSRTFEDLERIFGEMKKGGALPILMFLKKEF